MPLLQIVSRRAELRITRARAHTIRVTRCSDGDELKDRLRAAAAFATTTPSSAASASTPATPSPQPANAIPRLLDPPPAPTKGQRMALSTTTPGPS